ncbi:hypothetical protein [Thermoflexus sp.]|uniref:hypothetical protein n=1 Tax=Thermoflexus sp. TaxID=1969742 RepID=UPI002ADD90A6|nr:hypothetical protein [Thermoflexus sp.]
MMALPEIRDPFLHPPRLPWASAFGVSLALGGAAGLAALRLAGLEAAAVIGPLGFALPLAYLLGRPTLAWVRAYEEFLAAELDRRFAPLPPAAPTPEPAPEPTRILNGVVLIGAADAARPDGDRALRELIVGFARAAQVHGWGIRDLVGLRIRTSAGEIQITDPLWRAVTDALEGRGLLRKSNAGTFLAQDIEAVVAWAREGRIPPEIRHRLAPYLILSPAPAEAPSG